MQPLNLLHTLISFSCINDPTNQKTTYLQTSAHAYLNKSTTKLYYVYAKAARSAIYQQAKHMLNLAHGAHGQSTDMGLL